MAIDGAEGGLDAAVLAAALAGEDARVAIVHVETRAALEDELVAEVRRLLGADAPLLTARSHGVAAGLHELAATHEADLLVLGAHHLHRLHRFSRDHTRAALRELPCAAAVAPAGYAARPREIRTIGVGFIDDRFGRAVLDAARGLAWQLDAEVRATTVVPPSNWETADSGMGWKAAKAAQRLAQIPGIGGAAVEGEPHRALAAFSDEVDLLAIGSRHHSLPARLLLGDVAASLSHTSRCPLLVVPRGD